MKRFSLLLIVSICLLSAGRVYASQIYSQELYELIEEGLKYEGSDGEYLRDEDFCARAGQSSNADWFAFLAGQMGKKGDYHSALKAYVERWYASGENRLKSSNTTEWARICIADMALSGDCIFNGINLIADGTYDHEKYMALDDIYINGLDFMLIALDMYDDYTGQEHVDYKNDLCDRILNKELSGGGFSLMGSSADVDITAMSVTALSSHLDREDVLKCVERSITWLSNAQKPNGMYVSSGTENSESAAQVIIALCSVGIDPQSDERFVKDGVSVVDSLLSFKMEDGGFAHAFSKTTKSNELATAQALMALLAIYRYQNGLGTIYKSLYVSNDIPDDTSAYVTQNPSETIFSQETYDALVEENTEGLLPVSGETKADTKNLIIIIFAAGIILIIITVLVMRRFGKVEEE